VSVSVSVRAHQNSLEPAKHYGLSARTILHICTYIPGFSSRPDMRL
jgi:hypothetical protein